MKRLSTDELALKETKSVILDQQYDLSTSGIEELKTGRSSSENLSEKLSDVEKEDFAVLADHFEKASTLKCSPFFS